MKPLADFDALALVPTTQPHGYKLRIHTSLPRAVLVDAEDRDGQLAALGAMRGAYVLYLHDNILPGRTLPGQRPDPVLLDAGYRIGWMAENPITGQYDAAPGPELVLRADLVAAITAEKPLASPRAVMPDCVAHWAFNYGSRPAFYAGYGYASHLEALPRNAKSITIAATFGSDRPYADWWHLGLMLGLCGADDAAASYALEKLHFTAGARMPDRLQDLRRRLNAARGLSLQAIQRQNAAFFRAHRSGPAAPGAYADLAAAYQPLGKAGQQAAANWREASRWIWGRDMD